MSSTRIEELSWSTLAASLTQELIDTHALHSETLITAFQCTPRHVFVPAIHTARGVIGPGSTSGLGEHADDEWLDLTYSDVTLTTVELSDAYHGTDIPVSSSTRPSLMARMLETLQVKPGMRVLEIGTGTGYNAALLSQILGSENVYSIDIDPVLVDSARQKLETLGHFPTLAHGDGENGYPDVPDNHFDRIIATCAVPTIPIPWIRQLRPSGLLLANVRGEITGGPLCLAAKDCRGDLEVIGPFLDDASHFMWSRPTSGDTLPYRQATMSIRNAQRTTADSAMLHALLAELDDPAFRFLVQLQITGIRSLTGTNDPVPTISAHTIDGADLLAELHDDGTARITQTGGRRLWDTLVTTHTLWHHLDRPSATRYGVVVTPSVQFIFLDNDHAWSRWPLPLITPSSS